MDRYSATEWKFIKDEKFSVARDNEGPIVDHSAEYVTVSSDDLQGNTAAGSDPGNRLRPSLDGYLFTVSP